MELAKPDLDLVYASGWKKPERFVVKAADNITDLYGVMWKPSDFNPEKKYPIISSYKRGTKVTIIGNTSKGWYKVRIKDKKKDVVGYMSAKYIKL